MEKSKNIEHINIIVSQTNYTEEKAKKKLEEWNGEYMNVIREYLNPKFNVPKKEKEVPVNQKIMTEIRNFMDDINREAFKKKNRKFDEDMLN